MHQKEADFSLQLTEVFFSWLLNRRVTKSRHINLNSDLTHRLRAVITRGSHLSAGDSQKPPSNTQAKTQNGQ